MNMELKKIPNKLAIIGAGYIAIEFAFIFASLGSKVSLICRKNILRGFDDNLVSLIKDSLSSKGVNILLNQEVTKISLNKNLRKLFFNKYKENIFANEV